MGLLRKLSTAILMSMFAILAYAQEKCLTIVTPDLTDCQKNGMKFPINNCTNNEICNKTFKVSKIELEPMSSNMIPNILDSIFNFCCGKCTQRIIINSLTPAELLDFTKISTSHLVYPILSYPTTEELYGFYFIPLIEAPPSFLISKSIESEQILEHLIYATVHLWPFLVVCLLMAFVAGFPVWLIETWKNKEEFSRTFIIGLFEGFWWSFITMTTVGYGDKAPKFIVARIFAIIWIVIGITTMSMFTANLTMEIMHHTSPPESTMMGAKIGVLKDRIHEASVVLQKGGFVEATTNTELSSGINELIKNLQNDDVKAFLVDKHTYSYMINYFRNMTHLENSDEKKYATFFLNQTTHTQISNTGKLSSYGVLVKENEDYQYFRHFIRDNQRSMQICKELHIHHSPESLERRKHVFSTKYDLFRSTVKSMSIIIGILVIFGVTYETLRVVWQKRKTKKQELLERNKPLVQEVF